ncbi:hypothetical protein ACFQU2_06925 [Siccirubricoccus deserti]
MAEGQDGGTLADHLAAALASVTGRLALAGALHRLGCQAEAVALYRLLLRDTPGDRRHWSGSAGWRRRRQATRTRPRWSPPPRPWRGPRRRRRPSWPGAACWRSARRMSPPGWPSATCCAAAVGRPKR